MSTQVRIADLVPGHCWGERNVNGRIDEYLVMAVSRQADHIILDTLHSTCGTVTKITQIFHEEAFLNIKEGTSK